MKKKQTMQINNIPNNKRAVIYARVSTDEQGKGYSLSTQLEAGRQYAATRGYTLVAEFADEYTGASLDRPELNKLRELVANASINVVIVYDLDRIARRSVYQMLIEEELLRKGATVEYVNGQYEDTDEGRLQKQIKSSIAEYEKAKILERSKRGKRGKAKSGFVIVGARPPYGYKVVSEPHKTWLAIDEEEAPIVRLVYQWYVDGDGQTGPLSIHAIAVRLSEMHIPTRGDKYKHVAKKGAVGVWTRAMIGHILKYETYMGIWYYGRTKIISDGKELTRKLKPKCGLGKQVASPRSEWIAVEVPAIVDQETFARVQQRFRLNLEQAQRNAKHHYLLGRRLRCAHCGYTFVGRTRHKNNAYYCCNGNHQTPPVCHVSTFRVDLVDNTVWQWVKSVMECPENFVEGLRGTQAETNQTNQVLHERLALIESQLTETQNQLNKLLDLYLSGDFPKEVLTERKARLEKTITDLQHEHREITNHVQTVTITDEQIAEMEAFCAEVRDGLGDATFEDKRQYFDLLDVRGKLAIENGEKVVYVSCQFGKQRVSVAQTSPSSNTGATATTRCACR